LPPLATQRGRGGHVGFLLSNQNRAGGEHRHPQTHNMWAGGEGQQKKYFHSNMSKKVRGEELYLLIFKLFQNVLNATKNRYSRLKSRFKDIQGRGKAPKFKSV